MTRPDRGRGVEPEASELLRILEPEHVARVRPHLRSTQFGVGQNLYHEGQPAEFVWMVGSGAVRTLKGSPSGHVTTLEQLRAGEVFGMAALMDAPEYTESAQGVVAGRVWRAPRRVISGLLRAAPDLARPLLAIVARRLQTAHDRLCSFAHDSVPARVAQAVLEQDQGEPIETTRKVLGELAGTTVETTIRVLRSFERAGWVEGGVGWIRLLDRAALEAVARGDAAPR